MDKINFITEIASSHQGSVDDLIYLTEKHMKSKSNFLKYQIFKTENLFRKNSPLFTHYKKIELSFKIWEKIIKKYKHKLNLILEPFDEESYKFCKKFRNSLSIKISTSECNNIGLIQDALDNFKKIFINLSGLKLSDIKKIITVKKIWENRKKIILMYGFQSYPTNRRNLRIQLFKLFRDYGFKSGYADHSKNGINENLIDTCKFILKKNCHYLEKHVCINLKSKPLDYETSINVKDFNIFIKKIYNKDKIKDFKFSKKRSSKEIKYSLGMHKFAFAKKKIIKNKKISINQINFFRSSSSKEGLTRLDFYNNKIYSKKDIQKNQQIFPNMVF